MNKKIYIRTFEEKLLTKIEQEEKRTRDRKDKEEAKYYQTIFENPEAYFVMDSNEEKDNIQYDEILEDDM